MGQSHDMPFGIRDVAELLGLRIRRPSARGVYADCPFCGGSGKLHLNTEFDGWKCNRCAEHGGMLNLYCRLRQTDSADAYRRICDELMRGDCFSEYCPAERTQDKAKLPEQSDRADEDTVDKTYRALLSMLTLSKAHREHLRVVRGLDDAEIDRLGYKSTPPFYMCRPLTQRLAEQGFTTDGVPGFYTDKDGNRTVRFNSVTAGFLIPARTMDGKIQALHIRLDTPLKDPDAEPGKTGAKYIWLSSAGKPMGTSSGSPAHFSGAPSADVVYVTEGILKADVAHYLMHRTFLSTAGATNLAPLEPMLKALSEGGTRLVMEAQDMDKYRNAAVNNGASRIYLLAKKHGMDCRRLTWNPNYKGVDDWQLAIHRKKNEKEDGFTNYKERFLYGRCGMDDLFHAAGNRQKTEQTAATPPESLGLTEQEYALLLAQNGEELQRLLRGQQAEQKYRIYQLELSGETVVPFAFEEFEVVKQAGYEQPPAALYRLVHRGTLPCAAADGDALRLEHIFRLYNGELPRDYPGRSIAPSDVVELYDEDERRYFYRNRSSFCEVKFSPLLTKK